MPIRAVIAPTDRMYMGFVDRLRLHWMDLASRRGWDATRHGSMFGGVSEAAARRSVAYARTQGGLQ
jgi:hypothetical protein